MKQNLRLRWVEWWVSK